MSGTSLVETRGLEKSFPVKRGLLQRTVARVQAVRGVDLSIEPAETYALVGESGSGKTTLGRCLIRLIEPTAGSIRFQGEELTGLSGRDLRARRRHFQMVFQDPYGSLNPRMRVRKILGEPLAIHDVVPKSGREREVARLLDVVGLPSRAKDRFPHEFSGGQRQRIGIARALATRPEFVVADEPVSALDVSVQAQIVNLLKDLQERFELALLFIAHDLAVVAETSDRVGVMYLGRLVEEGATAQVFGAPQHPYTVSLLSAVPIPEPETGRARIILPGEPPSPTAPPPGCPFHTRCPIAVERCREEEPTLAATPAGHLAACHFPGELESAS
ncbi:MAG: ABC transporter ATP-binding protein [Thermoanaerobaculia bacterium]